MAQDRPNIFLAVFDSLSQHHLNQHLDDLPTLRTLAGESFNFTNTYTCCPEGSPARASLFTGLDMAVHGLWTDGVELPKRELPLPEVFASLGYQSWLVGRRHLAGVSNWTTEHARLREYHHFDWAHGPLHRSRQNAYLAWLHKIEPDYYTEVFPSQPDPDDTRIPEGQQQAMAELPDDLSFNTWVGGQSCRRMGKTPFLGVAGFVVGQSKGGSAAPLESCNPRALQQADAALGEILKVLPENSVVVVSAGRGCVDDGASVEPLQEAAIKVPLMIRSPNGTALLNSQVISTIDIAATLYDLANVTSPPRMQGRSLINSAPRGWALSRIRHPDFPHQTTLVHQDRKLIVTHGRPEASYLYDLQVDPRATQNLADAQQHQEDLEIMLDLMIDARVALEDRTEPRIAKF